MNAPLAAYCQDGNLREGRGTQIHPSRFVSGTHRILGWRVKTSRFARLQVSYRRRDDAPGDAIHLNARNESNVRRKTRPLGLVANRHSVALSENCSPAVKECGPVLQCAFLPRLLKSAAGSRIVRTGFVIALALCGVTLSTAIASADTGCYTVVNSSSHGIEVDITYANNIVPLPTDGSATPVTIGLPKGDSSEQLCFNSG